MWGCIKAPLGSSLVTKPSSGGTFGWAKGARNAFSGARFFNHLPCQLGLYLGLLGNSEPGGSSCMWGCIKAPLGVLLYPKPSFGGTFGWSKEKE